ncbi:MAG TPA: hypothetical protein VM513_29530 [Kofleriaceae bacterium]|jgi:hypothetical protein|nr:hypothetical protein [Kofleriaceae bacterium]
MTQLDLMSYTPVIDRDVKPAARPSIEERFRAFHAANPHVLEELLKLARAHLNAGATYISSKALYEACRVTLRTHHGDDYKLNNDYTPYYSDLMAEREPRLKGVFRTRQRRAK